VIESAAKAEPASTPEPSVQSEPATRAGGPSPQAPAPEGAAEDAAVDAGSPPPPFAGGLDSLVEIWPAVVELVRGEHALLGAVIKDARPVALDGFDLTLAFSSTAQFLRKKAEDPANRAIVGEALRSLAPGRWRLSYELRDVPGGEGGDDAEELTEDELVRRFIEEFDAEEVPADWLPEGHAEQQDPSALAAGERGA
jgi:DNA polymerase-3 subunit gamma/tau